MTVFATAGFGDITPRAEPARLIMTIQMIVDVIAVGVVARAILGATQVAARGRARP